MSVTVRIPAILLDCTEGASRVSVSGTDVASVLDDLERIFPALVGRIRDEDGDLHRFMNVFVDEDEVRLEQGLATPTPDGSEITVLPAVAGG